MTDRPAFDDEDADAMIPEPKEPSREDLLRRDRARAGQHGQAAAAAMRPTWEAIQRSLRGTAR